jgi:hypothetical protein
VVHEPNRDALVRQTAQRGQGPHHAVRVRLDTGRHQRGHGVDHQQAAALGAQVVGGLLEQGPPVRVRRFAGKRLADDLDVFTQGQALLAHVPKRVRRKRGQDL